MYNQELIEGSLNKVRFVVYDCSISDVDSLRMQISISQLSLINRMNHD